MANTREDKSEESKPMKALIVSSKSIGQFDSKVEIRADGTRILKSRTTTITAAGVAK